MKTRHKGTYNQIQGESSEVKLMIYPLEFLTIGNKWGISRATEQFVHFHGRSDSYSRSLFCSCDTLREIQWLCSVIFISTLIVHCWNIGRESL